MNTSISMAETPKKILSSKDKCFICSTPPTAKRERVCVFGGSEANIPELINSAIDDINIRAYSNSDIVICTKNCYKRLLRVNKLKKDIM